MLPQLPLLLIPLPTQQHRRKLELAPGAGLEMHSAQRESCSSCCPAGSCPGGADGGTGLPKGGSSKTCQQNRPAPSTVLPRAGPALRSQRQSVIQSKIILSIFDSFFPLESVYQKGLTEHQRLRWGSGKLGRGWLTSRGAWRHESLFSTAQMCSLGRISFLSSACFQLRATPSRGGWLWMCWGNEVEAALVAVVKRFQIFMHALICEGQTCWRGFFTIWVTSSSLFLVPCFWCCLCTIIYGLWEQIQYKRHVHKMNNVKILSVALQTSF